MTRPTGDDAMSSEHVEVLRDLSEVCRAAIKAGDWKVDGACDPDSLLRHADAAIASLSAPKPPAEAQPVAAAPGGLLPCPFCGADSADTGGLLPWVECTDCDASGPSCGTEEEAVAAWNRRTQPPSAPVGVEGVRREIQNALRELDAVMTAEDNTSDAVGCAELALQRALEALAQQPAAAGEDIMVNAAHDVYTLPLQPSGLSSGPRFVVHVPGPEQQPAAHPAITHCDNCGCDWLDNGLNPIGCPYCKQNAWRAAYVAERATRYREGGMKIEQARIHAETDATLMEQVARQQQGGRADG